MYMSTRGASCERMLQEVRTVISLLWPLTSHCQLGPAPTTQLLERSLMQAAERNAHAPD